MTSLPLLLLASGDPLHHNYDFPILSLKDGPVILTNHMVMMFLVFVFMLWAMPRAARAISVGKTGTSHDYVTKGAGWHLIEVICVFFREEVARPVLGRNTDKFMPYIWTTFFFILFNNLLGMVPLLDATKLVGDALFFRGGHETTALVDQTLEGGGMVEMQAISPSSKDTHQDTHEGAPAAPAAAESSAESGHGDAAGHGVLTWGPFVLFQDMTVTDRVASHYEGIGGTATGNIAVTFTLALIAITVIIGSGIRSLGLAGFFHHLTLDAPVLLWPLTVLLEIIGLIAKPFALMVRLFANMTAGHVMLSALLGFCSMAWNGMAILPSAPGHVEYSMTGIISAGLISVASITFALAVSLLELLVALIQAYVFAFLTTMFISLFQHHGHEHDHEHDHGSAQGHGAVVAAAH